MARLTSTILWAAMTVLFSPPARAAPSRLTVWAWERPEDLRFLPPDVQIGVQTGFVVLSGDRLIARGRRFALLARSAQVTTALVHVQIDPRAPLVWTPHLKARTVAAVLHFALAAPARRVQVDFEVRASQRRVLLDVLDGVRAGLPPQTLLSMTAIASWCDTENWIAAAPVDEVVPMLFRMGSGGAALKARLAQGGDFVDGRCRSALAVSTDSPITRAPPGRAVYLFNPGSWTPEAFRRIRQGVEGWDLAKP